MSGGAIGAVQELLEALKFGTDSSYWSSMSLFFQPLSFKTWTKHE